MISLALIIVIPAAFIVVPDIGATTAIPMPGRQSSAALIAGAGFIAALCILYKNYS